MITTMTFGIHRGESLRSIVLDYPGYALFLSKEKNPHKGVRRAAYTFHNMIGTFDSKPFVEKCSGNKCKRTATRCYICRDTATLLICCKKCALAGIRKGKFNRIRKFEDAVTWVEKFYWGENDDFMRHFIRRIACAKGLPKLADVKALREFLGDGEVPPNIHISRA